MDSLPCEATTCTLFAVLNVRDQQSRFLFPLSSVRGELLSNLTPNFALPAPFRRHCPLFLHLLLENGSQVLLALFLSSFCATIAKKHLLFPLQPTTLFLTLWQSEVMGPSSSAGSRHRVERR